MDSEEIVSARAALRYLARGDDPAKRARLAVIMLAFAFLGFACAMAVAALVVAVL